MTDLGSTNGTYVNGTRVRAPTLMKAGDVLRIGKIRLQLEVKRSMLQVGEGTPAAGREYDVVSVHPRQGKDYDYASPQNLLFLQQSQPPSATMWTLAGDRLTIGRDPPSDIVINDPHVSRHHADLVRHGRNWSITDADSVNGTSVNNARVRQITLQPGDRIRIGEVELILRSRR